jgi:hypothetical protein
MKLSGKFLFMGVETQQSQDGKNTYHKIGLMQGLQSKVFYVDEIKFKSYQNIPVSAPVSADVEITERDGKTYYKINDLQVDTIGRVNSTAKVS